MPKNKNGRASGSKTKDDKEVAIKEAKKKEAKVSKSGKQGEDGTASSDEDSDKDDASIKDDEPSTYAHDLQEFLAAAINGFSVYTAAATLKFKQQVHAENQAKDHLLLDLLALGTQTALIKLTLEVDKLGLPVGHEVRIQLETQLKAAKDIKSKLASLHEDSNPNQPQAKTAPAKDN